MKSEKNVCIIFTVMHMLNRLKELRDERDMKQLELAMLLNVGQQAISRYEKFERDLSTDLVVRICAIFNCTSDYLLCLSDRREPDLTAEEISLLAAWHAADDRAREMVQVALRPFMEKKEPAAG